VQKGKQVSVCATQIYAMNEKCATKFTKRESMPQHNTRIRYDDRTSETWRSLTIGTRSETQFLKLKCFRNNELQKLRLEVTAK
jgi:hypothetical protein